MAKKYSLHQYHKMVIRFNSLPFADKIRVLRDNPDIIILAKDGNFWTVKAIDKDIQSELEEGDLTFDIGVNDWGVDEIKTMLFIIGVHVEI